MPMFPKLVEMVAGISAGSVDTRPDGGGVTGLLAGSGAAGYWQLAPRSAGGANAGSGGTLAATDSDGLGVRARFVGLPAVGAVDAALLFAGGSPWVTSAMTRAVTAASASTDAPTMPKTRRRECVGG